MKKFKTISDIEILYYVYDKLARKLDDKRDDITANQLDEIRVEILRLEKIKTRADKWTASRALNH